MGLQYLLGRLIFFNKVNIIRAQGLHGKGGKHKCTCQATCASVCAPIHALRPSESLFSVNWRQQICGQFSRASTHGFKKA